MTPRRYMPALLLLFVLSGCAALDLRSRLVPAPPTRHRFVGGVARRAARHVHGRHVSRQLPVCPATCRRASIRCASTPTWSWASALLGLLILFGMPVLSNIYIAWGGSGPIGLLFRGVAASICLLPPTILMGATLPAMSRWVETSPQGVAWLGYFYGGNTGGAVDRQPARRLLPAARPRHGDRHLRGRGLNVVVGALAMLVARRDAVRGSGDRRRRKCAPLPAPGPSTSRSRSPA